MTHTSQVCQPQSGFQPSLLEMTSDSFACLNLIQRAIKDLTVKITDSMMGNTTTQCCNLVK